jgi:hypothetical protein
MSRAKQVYTTTPDSLEVFLALRELFSKNRCTLEFGAETLAELLCAERYVWRRVAAHEVEAALEVLLSDERQVIG